MTPRARTARRLIRLSLLSAGAYVAWIVVLNVALWTGFVAWAISGDRRLASLEVEHGWAWVLVPTRVHVRDFRLRIDAYRYQLDLQIPDGTLDLELLELAQRRFHARHIAGRRVSAVFRSKAPRGRVSSRRRAAFGEIEGLGDPILPVGPPNTPPHDEAWEVHIDAVDGDLERLFVNELELVGGTLALTGGLRTRAGASFRVDDSALVARDVEARMGGGQLATRLSGRIAIQVDDYDPFILTGRDVLRRVSARVDVTTRVQDVSPLGTLLPASSNLRPTGGTGPVWIRVDMHRGVVGPTTAIGYRTASFAVHTPLGRTRARARVIAFAGDAGLTAEVVLGDVRVMSSDRDDGGATRARAESIEATATTSRLDLTSDDFPLVDGSLKVTAAKITDPALLSRASKKVRVRSGTVAFDLHSRLDGPDTLRHQGSVRWDRLVVAVSNTSIRSTGGVNLNATSGKRLDHGTFDPLEVDVDALAIRSPKGHTTGTWVRARGRATWRDRGRRVEIGLSGRLEDLVPLLDHTGPTDRLIERLPDLGRDDAVRFIVAIKRDSEELDIVVSELARPGIRVEGIHHAAGGVSRSAFRFERMLIGVTRDERGDRKVEALADDGWMADKKRWARAR